MKTISSILILFTLVLFCSCHCDNFQVEEAPFAVPRIKSLSEIRANVVVETPKQTQSDGKIYVAQNYLFYIAKEKGIHVFNNQNPANPINIAFIKADGVHDIAVKDNFLYADNYVDLLVFDISNSSNITLVKTVENVIQFYPTYPDEADYYDYTVLPNQNEIIIGYKIIYRAVPDEQFIINSNDALAGIESGNTIGTGGSYAKFQINNNALYTIDSFKLNVFDISNPENTFFVNPVYMTSWFGGGVFETLFIQKEILFVGSTTGMYTVDANDEFNPVFVSGFSHATACDPVVVHGNIAYITVRGGSLCGAINDQINVIDVEVIANPTLISTTFINQPYGLGILNSTLYVCCESQGLKIFDASNASNLVLKNSYSENVLDVIPLNSHLITVGTNKIIQYNYGINYTLNQLSTINF